MAGWRRRAGRAQLCCDRRRAQDDFDPQRLISTNQLQRQAVARIEAVENGREFVKQVDLVARRGDDQILGLRAGAVGRSAAADAQHPNATAGIVVGKRAKIDPLGGGNRRCRWTVGSANARFQPIQWALCGGGRYSPSPAANNTTIPIPQAFFMFRQPFLKGSLSHTMEEVRPPRTIARNST